MKYLSKLIPLLFLCLISHFLFGNDGSYYTRGGVIYPIKETKISIEREILSFTVKDNVCTVNIYFEFLNPENIERNLQVGFQAPNAIGDVDSVTRNSNQISDFKVFANDKILSYEMKIADCDSCELREMKNMNFSQASMGVYVFLFNVNFKPGINKIYHSYSFPASNSVEYNQIYNYILTTGAKWAGSKIKNLSVQFDLGSNRLFYVKDVFGETANWTNIGVGKVLNEKRNDWDDTPIKLVRIESGKLQIDVLNFYPKANIEFGVIRNSSFATKSFDLNKIELALVYLDLENSDYKDYSHWTKAELKLLRNTIFAQHGYQFTKKELFDYFSQFEWYIPDPNLKESDIHLSKEEKSFVDQIKQLEKTLK